MAPIDFPQFNSIDTIDNWTILRLGVRNRLQTRRDNRTFTWFELDTFFDVNIDRPQFASSINFRDDKGKLRPAPRADTGTFSNIFNRIRFTPVPWVNLTIDSQLPLLDEGLVEVNSSLNLFVTENIQLNLSQRYLQNDPLINDSNQVSAGAYYRLNDNWAFGFQQRYEFQDEGLQTQLYQVHRDLSSWIASLGVVIHENKSDTKSVNEYGVTLTFTLKDVPSIRVPFSFDPNAFGGEGSGKNR